MYCIRWTHCLRYLNCNNLEVRCRGRRTFSQKCRMAASYTIRECKQMNSKKKKWKKSTRTKRPECCFGFVCDRVRRLFFRIAFTWWRALVVFQVDFVTVSGWWQTTVPDSKMNCYRLSRLSRLWSFEKEEKERAISDRNRLLIAAEEEAVGVCQSFSQATT